MRFEEVLEKKRFVNDDFYANPSDILHLVNKL